ncbi:MAG: hypothetical protein WCX71_02475 [Candidatus Buchananbacteria bacterium]
MNSKKRLPVFVCHDPVVDRSNGEEMLACFPTLGKSGVHVPYTICSGRSVSVIVADATECDGRCHHFTGNMANWRDPQQQDYRYDAMVVEAAEAFALAAKKKVGIGANTPLPPHAK